MRALLLDAIRGLRSRSGATLVAAGGLMVALTVCLLTAMLALALSATDPAIPDPERVVMLDFKGNIPGQPSSWFTSSPVAFGKLLKERHVPLDLISRTLVNGMDISIEGRLQPAYLLFADPDLVPLFGMKAVAGDVHVALTQHDGIAITLDLVRKLWGKLPPAQAVGRRIESRGKFYTVVAVIPDRDPRSPIWEPNPMVGNAMVMTGFDSQAHEWAEGFLDEIYVGNGRVFARLRPGTSVDQVGDWMRDAFEASPRYTQLPAEWRTNREAAFFRGITLKELPFEGADNELRWRLIRAVAGASLLLLILAAFNCMNLETANLLQRQRETALRRSVGADASHLLRLWGTEVLLSLLLASAGALLLAWCLAPAVQTFMGLAPVHGLGDSVPLPVLAGLVIVVLVLLPLTLAFPAWMALRRPPAPALQGRTASEGPWGKRIRQALLALQLSGALLLLSLAGVLATQQYHLLHADRGFETHNRLWLGLMVNPAMVPNLTPFLSALERNPVVKSWAFSDSRPARDVQGGIQMHTGPTHLKQVLRVTYVSPSFFETYGMTVLAGEPKMTRGEIYVVIDAKAAFVLGFRSPQAAVGQILLSGGGYLEEGTEPRRVVAVVKAVNMESARARPMEQAFVLTDKPQWDLSIYGTDLPLLRRTVDELWRAHGPKLVYTIESADEQRAEVYRQEQQFTTMLTAVALLALGVAMLGAFALVADTLRRRRTELVLRRLHGAGDLAVLRHVAGEFAVPLLIGAVVSLPLAAWLGERYLGGFVDRVNATSGVVAPTLIACAALLVVTAIAALQHFRQALALQPIEALR